MNESTPIHFAPYVQPPASRRYIALAAAFAVSIGIHAAAAAVIFWEHGGQGTLPVPSDAISINLVASEVLDAVVEDATLQEEAAARAEIEAARNESKTEEVTQSLAVPEEKTAAPISTTAPEVEAAAPAPVVEKAPPPKPKQQVTEPRSHKPPKRAQTASLGSGAKSSSGKVSGSQGNWTNYGTIVRTRIARNAPSGQGRFGIAKIAFAISPSGRLAFARLTQSSGNAALDSALVQAVRSAAPFPPPPGGQTFSTSVPFGPRRD